MATTSAARPLPKALTVAGPWAATFAATASIGAAVAAEPRAVVAGAALAAAGGAMIVAFAQPRWVLLGSIFLLVTYAVAVLREDAGSPLTMRTIVLLLLLGLGTRYAVGIERRDWPARETLLLAALGAALLLSAAFADDAARSLARVLELSDSALFALLIVVLVDGVRWLYRAMWAYVAAAGGLAALAVVQQVAGTNGSSFGGFANVVTDGSLARSTGPIDANYFGQLTLAAAALAVYLALAAATRSGRALAIALGLACVGALVFTFSRGSLLAALVVACVVAWLRRVPLALPLVGAVAIAVAAVLFLPTEARQRVLALAQPAQTGVASGDPSLRGRFAENLAAVQMFVDHPYVGVGPDNYPVRYLEYSQSIGLDPRTEERQPHNLYLEAFAETGVVGAAVLFAVLALAARGAWRARRLLTGRGAVLAEGAFVALLAFLVNGIFLQASYPHYLWITIGLALAAARLGRSTRAWSR